MALNWDAFLTDESLNMPNDQWSDQTAIPTDLHHSIMPKSITSDTSATPEDVTNFESLPKGLPVDPYFDDSIFISNDYCLGDLDVLKPFGNTASGGASTSESSPEPTYETNSLGQDFTNFLAELDQLPQMSMTQPQVLRTGSSLTRSTPESMFPNNLGGLVDDFDFSNEGQGVGALKEPFTEITSGIPIKRNKNKPDILSACWTSPLCPNHDVNGTPPNPSTCGGGCAPFLFADGNTLPTLNNLLADPEENSPTGVVEIQPRSRKRSESDTSREDVSARQRNTNDASSRPSDSRPQVKRETTASTPDKDSPQPTIEDKPKTRRRLPHNQVERKYRESLNTQLESLRRVVPSLQENQTACDGADIEDLPTPSKPSKAVILASATAYIKQQQRDRKSLAEENQALKAKIKALQALVKCDDCSLMHYVMDMKINQEKK